MTTPFICRGIIYGALAVAYTSTAANAARLGAVLLRKGGFADQMHVLERSLPSSLRRAYHVALYAKLQSYH